MTWQRIDENTYIDDTLVTCAEYQLFIDEMREQGKYHQPDHWTSYQFPEGQAREPILGVRYSDAGEFCKWLTQRMEKQGYNGWKYKLPSKTEIYVKLQGIASCHTCIGFWTAQANTSNNFNWIGNIPEDARILDFATLVPLVEDVSRAQIIRTASSVAFADALERAQKGSQNPNKESFQVQFSSDAIQRFISKNKSLRNSFYEAVTRSRNRPLDYSGERSGDFSYDLDKEFSRAISSDRKLFSKLDADQDLIHSFDNFFPAQLNRSLNNASDRSLTFALSYALDLFVDILTLRERIAGRSPAFEGIRLVKERIK